MMTRRRCCLSQNFGVRDFANGGELKAGAMRGRVFDGNHEGHEGDAIGMARVGWVLLLGCLYVHACAALRLSCVQRSRLAQG